MGVDAANINCSLEAFSRPLPTRRSGDRPPAVAEQVSLGSLAARSVWAAVPEAGVASLTAEREGEPARAGEGWRASPRRHLTCSLLLHPCKDPEGWLFPVRRRGLRKAPDVKTIAVSSVPPSSSSSPPTHPLSSGPADPLQEGPSILRVQRRPFPWQQGPSASLGRADCLARSPSRGPLAPRHSALGHS